MKRVKNSTGVSSLGLFLILVAFAWTCLTGNHLHMLARMARGMAYSSRTVSPVERVTQIGEDEFMQEDNAGPESSNSSRSFSFKSDFLCIYGTIDWGKTIRILLYLAGGALLLLSTVKKPV